MLSVEVNMRMVYARKGFSIRPSTHNKRIRRLSVRPIRPYPRVTFSRKGVQRVPPVFPDDMGFDLQEPSQTTNAQHKWLSAYERSPKLYGKQGVVHFSSSQTWNPSSLEYQNVPSSVLYQLVSFSSFSSHSPFGNSCQVAT